MRKKYIIGALIAICCIGVNQSYIQYWLNKKKQDATILNLAGRQRMLSQRLNLAFYKMYRNEADSLQLQTLFNSWQKAHYVLLNGSPELHLSPISEPNARKNLVRLSKNIDSIKGELSSLQHLSEAKLASINITLNNFLKLMDETERILELDANKKLKSIITIEILLALLSILIITLEILYIFIPLEKNLRIKMRQHGIITSLLAEQNRKLREIARLQSHEVRRPLTSIMGLVDLITKENKTNKSLIPHITRLKESSAELDDVIHKMVDQTIMDQPWEEVLKIIKS